MVAQVTCSHSKGQSVQHPRSGARLAAATTAVGVLIAPLAVVTLTAAPANAAPVTINLVGINDFHGRMNLSEDTSSAKNTNTVKFAGTVAQCRGQFAQPDRRRRR